MSDTVYLFGEEYDDSPWGFLDFLGDTVDPRNLVSKPDFNTIARMGYVPAHFLAAAKLIAFGTGEKIGFAELLMHSTDMRKKMFRSILSSLPTILRNAPGAAIMGATVHGMATKQYEYTPGGFIASQFIKRVDPWNISSFEMRQY